MKGDHRMRVLYGMIFATAFAGLLYCQEPSGSEIKNRRENQQDRIANGVASGQLTAGEAARLENQEARINKEITTDRKANGGSLTTKQKAQVNRQLNRESRRIYHAKHNAAKGPH